MKDSPKDRPILTQGGVRNLFGKRYMWLLDERGNLGLHKVDDKGGDTGMETIDLLTDDYVRKTAEREGTP